jgi:methyltransferase (TIGR00027 family)
MDPVAHTALWVAAARAHESSRPDALFHDPFAALLAGVEGERWIEETDDGLVASYIALRTRFFDDELLRATHEEGIRQVVILAAGVDARAFRLKWPQGTRVFELDRPEVLAHKDRVLAAIRAEPTCTRATLGVDLTTPWAASLVSLGFAPTEPSAWLVEGLLPYLREAEVGRLFAQIGELAAPDSVLAFDCAGTDPFSEPAFAEHAAKMKERGIAMHFSCSDPAALLERFGWSARAFTMPEMAARARRAMPVDPLRSFLVAGRKRAATPNSRARPQIGG